MHAFSRSQILFATSLLGLGASPAMATVGGPSIAYSQSNGKGFDLILANADGTGQTKLYSSASGANIARVDIKPGGNKLALVEQVSGQYTLKIITYTDAGISTGIKTVDNTGCNVLGFDFSPVDGSLLVSRNCDLTTVLEVRRYVDGVGYDSVPIVRVNAGSDKVASNIRWLGDGSGFLWAFGNLSTGGGAIERHMMNNPYSSVVVYRTGSAATPNYFDVARCAGALDATCSKLLVTNQSGQLHLVTFDAFGGTDQGTLYSSASDGHFSPDDAHVLWRRQTKSGYQLMVDSQVIGSGGFGGKDWRQ